jgi:predicted phage-related endonuclease
MKKFKNGAFPDTYYVQCVHYMMVTGCKKWYLAVLVLNKEFMVFEIERDEDEIKALAKAEEEFWKLVESETPPMTDGNQATSDTLDSIYPESNSETVSLFGYENELAQYVALTAQIKELEKLKDAMANKVKAFLGEAGRGESDRYNVSWTSTTRSTFDSKRYASEHPDLDLSNYYKTLTYRTFKVNEIQN